MKQRIIKFRAWDNDFHEFTNYHLNKALVVDINKYKRFVFTQFTGLLDKNGKEIYEGDLYLSYGQVKLVQWEVYDNYQGYSIDTDDLDLEVIGNIFETPELIK